MLILKKVIFQKGGNVYDGVVEADKTALIPDVLLISAGVLTVQYEGVNDDGYICKEKENIRIHQAPKPEGYVKPDVAQNVGGGSSSGGVLSWNDLTDKPFEEKIERKYVFKDQIVLSQSGGSFFESDAMFDEVYVEVGDTITFVIDGESYAHVVDNANSINKRITGVFNINMFCNDRSGWIDSANIYVNGIGEHTLTIYKDVLSVTQLDEKFIPDVILKSPDGTRWKLEVDNAGNTPDL